LSDDDDDKHDLTRIEDLAEFLHDESDDSLFDDIEEEASPSPALPTLDDLESDEALPEINEEPPTLEAEPVFETSEPEEESDSFSGDEFGSSQEFGSEFETSEDDQEDNAFGGSGEEDEFSNQFDQESSDSTSEFGSNEGEGFESDGFGSDSETGFESDETSEDEFKQKSTQEESEELSAFEDTQPDDDDNTSQADSNFEPPEVSSFEEQEVEQKPHVPQQNFEDLRQFAERISYGAVAQGGNPPFSLVLRGIRYQEDAEDIQIILKEHGLVSDDNQQSIEQGLANGSLLISQISEYSAIYLAHKFRRFDLDVIVGLSDEIHPSQSYDADARGLVSKQNIRQNVHESINLDRSPVKIQNIILSTTPTLEGYNIQEYLSVISHHNILSANEIEEFSTLNISTGDEIVDAIQKDLTEVLEKHGTHESEVLMPFGQGLETLYKEMADALRTKALKIGANAVVGINYQLTPVFSNQSGSTDVQYKVTCLGSAVWVVGN